jgi:hypothetical protein
MTPTLSLAVAIVALIAWALLIFVRQVPSGLPHGLYAVGILLLVRWLVLRGAAGSRGGKAAGNNA